LEGSTEGRGWRYAAIMDIEWIRKHCLSLAGATEQVQWGCDLVFKVGGKMFAVTPLEPARVWLSLKCEAEEFAELIERPGVIPAPYLARASWIAIEREEAVARAEVLRLLSASYELVFAKLPKRLQTEALTSVTSKKKTAVLKKTIAKKPRAHKARR
jgi:predicted DNA-binding protein (MmcQ/YjbR family)